MIPFITQRLSFLFVLCAAALLTGCASGPKYNTVKGSFPPIPKDQGRIYFYRTAVMGAAIQPAIKLNGENVGKAQPKGFFFVDRPAGSYEVSTKTEVTRRCNLTLEKDQTQYVRLGLSMGLFVAHVYPEVVYQAEAEEGLAGCSYTGSK